MEISVKRSKTYSDPKTGDLYENGAGEIVIVVDIEEGTLARYFRGMFLIEKNYGSVYDFDASLMKKFEGSVTIKT